MSCIVARYTDFVRGEYASTIRVEVNESRMDKVADHDEAAEDLLISHFCPPLETRSSHVAKGGGGLRLHASIGPCASPSSVFPAEIETSPQATCARRSISDYVLGSDLFLRLHTEVPHQRNLAEESATLLRSAGSRCDGE